MLLAIDVGNTQTVFGLFDGDRLTEQFRVGTDPSHTADELAVLLRAFVDLGALDGIVLSSTVPQLVREYERFAERWAGADLLVLGPGVSTGRADPLRRPARGRARPDRERGRRARAPRRARRSSSTSAPRPTSTSSRPAGEYARRRARAGDRDLDGRALRPRRPAAEGAVRGAGARDRQDDRRRRSSRASSTASPARSTRSSTGSATSSARPTRRSSPPGGLADLIAPHSRTITAVDPELTCTARLGAER